jgi:hypothetical protein
VSDAKEWVTTLKDYVPLFQTLVWAGLLLFAGLLFRREVRQALVAVAERVKGGSSVELGVFKLGADLRNDLPYVAPGGATAPAAAGAGRGAPVVADGTRAPEGHRPEPQPARPESPGGALLTEEHWAARRRATEREARGVYVVHVLAPSQTPGQRYDLFIYLVAHRDADLTTVRYAEFFLGRYWGSRVFRVENSGERIGISTSAYGPVLCLCRVTFEDGHESVLYRYIDFEMGTVFEAVTAARA